MKLKAEVVLSASFIHKQSGKMFDVDKVITQEYDEHSEEYKLLCKTYEEEFNMKRETNKDKFDKMLLETISEVSKESCKETVDNLSNIFKKHCKDNAKGYITFGGWILNLDDFSGVLFKDLKVNISKLQ